MELHLGDRMAVGCDTGGKANGCGRRVAGPVSGRGQRDNGSNIRGQGDRVTDLAGEVALQSIGIVSGDGEEIDRATGQARDG